MLHNINESILNPKLSVMNYLHTITMKYPHAISFCSGRPADELCDINDVPQWINTFTVAQQERPNVLLGQYGPTNGIINEHIAKMLQRDEGLSISPEDIVVTVGGQEAMLLGLLSIFNKDTDVLLVTNPCYIGISGAAKLIGIELEPVHFDGDSLIENIQKAIFNIKEHGKVPKAIYVIPDFDNPQGYCMSLKTRLQIIKLANRHQILIFEDNAYRLFNYEGIIPPMINALDQYKLTISMGSFAKTIFPGIRIGYLISEQFVVTSSGNRKLTDILSVAKSLVTVNTSPITQAAVGGCLIQNNYSLKNYNSNKIQLSKHRRDLMLECLSKEFSKHIWHDRVSWNHPTGGFFIIVTLPFETTPAHLEIMARDYNVLVLPIEFLSITSNHKDKIRLAFSNCNDDQIKMGIKQLADFVLKYSNIAIVEEA